MLENLNSKQREAVETIGGPILIFAGAGSGKTRVLTHKIAYLVQEIGLLPEKILAVTFTNKAASEMKARVSELLSIDVSKMNVGTFHSINARLLRKEIPKLGYHNDFVIYDQADSKSLIKESIKELNLDPKQYDAGSFQSQISNKKNQMITVDIANEMAEGYLDQKVAEVYDQYQQKLFKNNAVDFDDLLLLPLRIFNEFPERLTYYQSLFQYVLVDEYQDTNRPQFEFVYNISCTHQDICVVGDDDQSIYGWRGADIKNILNFTDAFGKATVIKLEQNYRSTQNILKAAHAIVSMNENRAEKELWTKNVVGDKIQISVCIDERDEARKIINEIQTLRNNKTDLSEMVILYRTNAQSRALEDEFRRNAIPYQLVGGVKFYERKEVKDVLAYLRLILNPADTVSFDRVINFPPRGVGKTSLQKIKDNAKYSDVTQWAVLEHVDNLQIGFKQKKSIREFHQLIFKYCEKIDTHSAKDIVIDLMNDLELHEFYLNQHTVEARERWDNIDELISSITEFTENNDSGKLREFLEEVSLLADIDRYNQDTDMVTLMTVHSSKGLEYPIVFITGLEEGLFPIRSYSDKEQDLEEERRLFYVAITRAMRKAFLFYANSRRRFGGQPEPVIVSRFINEIPEALLEYQFSSKRTYQNDHPSTYIPKRKSIKRKSSLHDFAIGSLVNHKVFGKGKIISIEGEGETAKLQVIFVGNVKKKLIQKYANLILIPSD